VKATTTELDVIYETSVIFIAVIYFHAFLHITIRSGGLAVILKQMDINGASCTFKEKLGLLSSHQMN
jgi:hypothetical protein